MTTRLLLSAALLLPALAHAQTTNQGGPEAVELTVYNNNLALVSETRALSLSGGAQAVELPGVSSRIQPTSAVFVADGVRIREQNFDFDLLSPEKLMEKAVGGFVEVVRTNPGNGRVSRERARVLSVNNGVVVEIDGRIEVLRDDDIPTRVVFPDVPENLRAEPTLSILLEAERGGRREAELSYLTEGMSWRSDYVASFDAEDSELDLQGWATLTNTTETTFADAKVAVVAGFVAGTQGPGQFGGQFRGQPFNGPRGSLQVAGTRDDGTERLGDNYLYPLPGAITVRANQTKQIGIVDAGGLAAEKVYEYRAFGFNTQGSPQPVDVRVAFSNTGAALPAGTLRVYEEDAEGTSRFVGEDVLTHVPAGSQLAVRIGEAFDVRVQPTVVEDKAISRRVRDVSMRYRVTNAAPEPRTVRIRQGVSRGSWVDYEVLSESEAHSRPDAHAYLWEVEVPAEGEAVLEFALRERQRW